MKKIKVMANLNICLLLVTFFFVTVNAQQECTSANTPKLKLPAILELNQDENFRYDINLTANLSTDVLFSWVPINFSVKNFEINRKSGFFNLTPAKSDIGRHSIYVLATTQQGCFDMRKLELAVFDKPSIYYYSPQEQNLLIKETDYLTFKINASTRSSQSALKYDWFVNSRKVKSNSNEFSLFTNYSDAGSKIVTAVVTDSRGLNNSIEWRVSVSNKNRRPYQRTTLPNLIVTKQTEGKIMNLYNYLYDPDNEILEFRLSFYDAGQEKRFNDSKIFSVTVDKKGDLSISNLAEIYETQYIIIQAVDPQNLSIESEPFTVRLATSRDKFEYFSQKSASDKCVVDIQCLEWSECKPEGVRVRECFDQRNCNQVNDTLLESEKCDYNSTCFDKIKNQDETEIDCGGPCKLCPTCEDKIMNQAETGIDCGGPCKPCPSCFDGQKNQEETDTDCGGPCNSCESGLTCVLHTDCLSQVCNNKTCSFPTCFDYRLNQGEKGIDCGGPCKQCPTCEDKIMNQAETGIDCGGPCRSCSTCDDNIRNQGEAFADCGGPCDTCLQLALINFVRANLLVIFILVLLSGIALILNIVYRRDKIAFLYRFSRFTRFLPNKLPVNSYEMLSRTIDNLDELKLSMVSLGENSKIKSKFNGILDSLFKELFDIDGSVTRGSLHITLKNKVMDPFLINLFMELYDSSVSGSPEASLFTIEMSQNIDHAQRIIDMVMRVI